MVMVSVPAHVDVTSATMSLSPSLSGAAKDTPFKVKQFPPPVSLCFVALLTVSRD